MRLCPVITADLPDGRRGSWFLGEVERASLAVLESGIETALREAGLAGATRAAILVMDQDTGRCVYQARIGARGARAVAAKALGA